MRRHLVTCCVIAVTLGAVSLVLAQQAPSPAAGNAAPKAKGKGKGPPTPSGPAPGFPMARWI